jgi:hypothetical protein
MKRVLITGMSGTGKSVVIRELAARGPEARDLDTSEWSQWIDVDPSDSLTPLGAKTGFGRRIVFALCFFAHDPSLFSSAVVPRTWDASST